MFQQIDANDINGFGIRRLVHMELNDLHPSPPCLAWEPYVTMIGYAAWRKRERIVKGLLRAGADPGVRWCDGKSDYEKLHSGAGTPQGELPSTFACPCGLLHGS